MNTNSARDITQQIGSSKSVITVTETRPCCFRVASNGKPLAEFCEKGPALQYAFRHGYRGPGQPNAGLSPAIPPSKPAANETAARLLLARQQIDSMLAANECIQAIGPTMVHVRR